MRKIIGLCMAWAMTATASTPMTTFSPYVDMTLPEADHYLLTVNQVAHVESFHLAFITNTSSTTNCAPAWGGYQDYALPWASDVTDSLHKNTVDYVVSFGGAAGVDISNPCSLPDLVKAYENVINIYQPSGLDFDIENGTANVQKIMDALKQVEQDYPQEKISFTLPVMPEGLTSWSGGGQDIVKAAKADGLSFTVNLMTMDYGSSYLNDMEVYAEQAATNVWSFLKGLYPEQSDLDLWQRIEVTPMIGQNDVNGEIFYLTHAPSTADACQLYTFANKNHLRGISMWSINRDYPCVNGRDSNHCSGVTELDYGFSKAFLTDSCESPT